MQLITWNIQWGRGVDGRVDLDRIAAHVRRLGDADVICLQEVSNGFPELPGNDASDQFAALAERFPGYTAVAGIATDLDADGSRRRMFGNMILSRLPVRQVFRHLLPWPVDPGVRSMQRIALEANLDTPLGTIRVTTTHLEYYSALQRTAQVARLRDLHREAVAHVRHPHPGSREEGPFYAEPRGARAILVGDCNFLPQSEHHAQLIAPIDADTPAYCDVWEFLYPDQPHAPTVGLHDKTQWPDPPFTFDYVFASEDLLPHARRIAVGTDSDASDHQPVLVEFG